MVHTIGVNEGVVANRFVFTPKYLGKMFTHFDEHIFSDGLVKNHQLEKGLEWRETCDFNRI